MFEISCLRFEYVVRRENFCYQQLSSFCNDFSSIVPIVKTGDRLLKGQTAPGRFLEIRGYEDSGLQLFVFCSEMRQLLLKIQLMS